MTYQDPPEQQPWQQQPPASYPASNPQPPPYPTPPYPTVPTAKPPTRILGMPVWVFAIGLFVVICCGGGAIFAAIGGVLGEDPEEVAPTLECTVVSVDEDPDAVLQSAEVQWQITNPGESDGYWLVNVAVLDANGRTVGETSDGGFDVEPGATEVSSVTVYLDAAGAETCVATVD